MNKALFYIFSGILVLVGLYVISLYSYPLFHSIAEVFSIVIAFGVFMVAWHSRKLMDNDYLLFIGIAYLFVGCIDFVHTLAYKGMDIFRGFDANLPTQLWIAGRYMESLALLVAPLFFHRRLRLRVALCLFCAATILLFFSVFSWKIFPDCFIEGRGLTPFKVVSEYIISFFLLSSIGALLTYRDGFDTNVLRLIVWSIIVTIISELSFTFYVSVYGISNLIGHYGKILSFYLMYKAVIATGLETPYAILLRDLQKSEQRYRLLFEHMSSGVAIYEAVDDGEDFVFKDFNEAGETIEHVRREDIIGKRVTEVFPGVKEFGVLEVFKRVWKTGRPEYFPEALYQDERDPGSWRESWVYKLPAGQIVAVYNDITARKQAEEKVRKSESLLKEAQHVAHIGHWELDLAKGTPTWSEEIFHIFGLDPELGEPSFEAHQRIVHPDDWGMMNQAVTQASITGTPYDITVRVLRPDATIRWMNAKGYATKNSEGSVVRIFGTAQDVTEQKDLEEKLQKMTVVDDLTGAYNRRGFLTLAEQQLKIAERSKNDMLLFFADLDHMKEINDALGHQEGDRALSETASILKDTFRESDIIGRIGGDEFAVLVIDAAEETQEAVLKRLRNALEFLNRLEGRRYMLSLSMGVAHYGPENPSSLDELMAKADTLMYEEKRKKERGNSV